ncbi:7808_t:CDS:2 [Scutellospora calospora]|uniref:7808_t:CDS:1 n=1 Tax=Scutellospora calospora TaxID=85575 RepID=A0ACA9MIF1_9GLOM|nr:7808_t:CDS:2 [Scutellospora calospora]
MTGMKSLSVVEAPTFRVCDRWRAVPLQSGRVDEETVAAGVGTAVAKVDADGLPARPIRIVPRNLVARQLKRLHVVWNLVCGGAGGVQVANSCGGRVLDERRIVETSTGVVSLDIEIVVGALSALVRLDLSLEAVVLGLAGGSEGRRGD